MSTTRRSEAKQAPRTVIRPGELIVVRPHFSYEFGPNGARSPLRPAAVAATATKTAGGGPAAGPRGRCTTGFMEDVFYALPVIPRPRARPTTGSDRGSLRSRDLTLFVSLCLEKEHVDFRLLQGHDPRQQI
jgi:hypothetical protein